MGLFGWGAIFGSGKYCLAAAENEADAKAKILQHLKDINDERYDLFTGEYKDAPCIQLGDVWVSA